MMLKYKVVSAKNMDVSTLIDPVRLEAVHKQYLEFMAFNEQIHQNAVVVWQTMCDNAAVIYGEKSSMYKYLRSHKVPNPPYIAGEWEKLMKALKAWQRKEERRLEAERKAEAKRLKAEDYKRRRQEAVEILKDNGYVPNEHFPKTRAITFKKEVIQELPDGSIAPRMLPVKAEGEREW